MDLTCDCPTGAPNEKTVRSGWTRRIRPAEIIFKFQVFKKPTDININRAGFPSPITVYTSFDHYLPHFAITLRMFVEKTFV